MARKGTLGTAASWLRAKLGGDNPLYRFMKGLGHLLSRGFSWLERFTPADVAYRLHQPVHGTTTGYVTRVDKRGVTGFVLGADGTEPAMVELLVDGQTINKSYACQKVVRPSCYAGLQSGFYFPMKKIWAKVPQRAVLEVRTQGGALRYRAGPGPGRPLPNLGPAVVEGPSITELAGKGYLITKFGRLQKPRHESAAWAEKAFGSYARLNEAFEAITGKKMFAFYGVMLGYAREGGVLAHDMDLDLAYFSDLGSPEEVHQEFRQTAAQLIEAGITVIAQSYKLTFGGLSLSLTPCWIADGVFSSTFGYVGDGFSVSREDILPLRKAFHGDHVLWLPNDPQAVAAYVYGKGWRYPDPGWKWLPEYKNRPDVLAARLTEREVRELNALASRRTGASA